MYHVFPIGNVRKFGRRIFIPAPFGEVPGSSRGTWAGKAACCHGCLGGKRGFRNPAEVTVTPKLTRISGEMTFVDWIGWQFLDVFLSYFLGDSSWHLEEPRFCNYWFFFDVGKVLLPFEGGIFLVPAKHPYYTKKQKDVTFWLTKGFLAKLNQPHLFTSSPRKLLLKLLRFLKNFPQRHVFRQFFVFSEAKCLRQIVHHDGNLDLCLRVRLDGHGGRNSMPRTFRKDRQQRPWIEDPKNSPTKISPWSSMELRCCWFFFPCRSDAA